MLAALPETVTAEAYFTSSASPDSARGILNQYKNESDGKFDFVFIDPVKNPVAAQNANITTDGTVVLRMGDRMEPVSYLSEEQIDIALVKLINPQSRSVYFLTGHGEHDITSSDQEIGLSALKTMLESKNYSVAQLNLLLDNQIPDDASVIVIDGPQKALSQTEVNLLKNYLAKGKALILLQDSIAQYDTGDAVNPLADYIASEWGLVINTDLVVDLSSNTATVAIGNPSTYGASPITTNMGNLVTVFPIARSISATPVDGVTQVQLVNTSTQSWGEVSLEAIENTSAQYDEGLDFLGPLTLAYTAENTTTGSRLIVFGDTDFSLMGISRPMGTAISWSIQSIGPPVRKT